LSHYRRLLLSLASPLPSTIASREAGKWFGVVPSRSTTASSLWVVSHTPLAAMSELAILEGAFAIIVEPAHFRTPQGWTLPLQAPPRLFWGPHLSWTGTTQLVIEGHIHPCPVFFTSCCHLLSEGHIILLPCWLFCLTLCFHHCEEMTHKSRGAFWVLICHCCSIASKTLDPGEEVIHRLLPWLRHLKTREHYQFLSV